jgi:tetratricopeptide (TPR) repeat protein
MRNRKAILVRSFLALTLAALAIAVGPFVPAVGAVPAGHDAVVQRWQSQKIGELTEDLEDSEENFDRILIPVTVLIGILALGGGLGIVFSIRDQRRVSQLHELTVTGEVSSQRRSEQSYASFLEQSQTTLSLVNDTLELAKEATDRATKSVEEKTELQRDAIEERAQRLMLDVFNSNEFELVVMDPDRREELHAIGREVRALEGQMGLQNVELKDYAKFVKALDQFLLDETEAALQALQLAAQSAVVGDLQRFIEYWLGYMMTTVGMYAEAVQKFEHDERSLPPGSPQYLQLERIKEETRFFSLAKPDPDADYWDKKKKVDTRPPHVRFERVDSLLDKLEVLAAKVAKSEDHKAKPHTQLEIARTRADVFEWVAYDESHLDEPLEQDAIDEASEILDRLEKDGEITAPQGADEIVEAPEEPKRIHKLRGSPLLSMAEEKPDLLRCWALREAQRICEEKFGEPSMEVDFALAECYFKLRDQRAIGAFEKLEKEISGHFDDHREKRHDVAMHQSLLICICRLFTLRKEAVEEDEARQEEQRQAGEPVTPGEKVPRRNKDEEERHILRAQRETGEKLNQIPRGQTTIFSHIQRRNLTQDEFRAEIKAIIDQEKGMEQAGEGKDVEEAGA